MDDEKKKDVVDVDEKFTDEQIKKLPAELQKLINYKCSYTVDKNGVTFNPSPHLYDKDGKLEIGTDKREMEERLRSNMDHTCSFVASTMNCDKVEAAFMDHSNEKIKNTKVLEQSWQMHHGFIRATELAWKEHYPLKLDPTHIWLLILQAIAMHVDMNSELLRNKWVNFKGTKKLIVNRDDFVKGLRQKNNWGEVIVSFCKQIDENTNDDCVPLLECDFSNATIIDKIATKVTIMDICKSYFEFIVRTRCGFPQITLTGTKQDWQKIYIKTEKLLKDKVEPNWGKQWSQSLLPVLKRFIQAFDGKIDCLFWNSMIKRGARRGSGGWSWYSGWMNIFFPYIKGKDNQFCVPYCSTSDYITQGLKDAGKGNDINNYPYGLASAPVKWEYLGSEFKLKFISGFIGVTQDEKSQALSPMVGWVIGEQSKENTKAMESVQLQFQQKNKQPVQER